MKVDGRIGTLKAILIPMKADLDDFVIEFGISVVTVYLALSRLGIGEQIYQ